MPSPSVNYCYSEQLCDVDEILGEQYLSDIEPSVEDLIVSV